VATDGPKFDGDMVGLLPAGIFEGVVQRGPRTHRGVRRGVALFPLLDDVVFVDGFGHPVEFLIEKEFRCACLRGDAEGVDLWPEYRPQIFCLEERDGPNIAGFSDEDRRRAMAEPRENAQNMHQTARVVVEAEVDTREGPCIPGPLPNGL